MPADIYDTLYPINGLNVLNVAVVTVIDIYAEKTEQKSGVTKTPLFLLKDEVNSQSLPDDNKHILFNNTYVVKTTVLVNFWLDLILTTNLTNLHTSHMLPAIDVDREEEFSNFLLHISDSLLNLRETCDSKFPIIREQVVVSHLSEVDETSSVP